MISGPSVECGARRVEIFRLEREGVLWDQGFIEIKDGLTLDPRWGRNLLMNAPDFSFNFSRWCAVKLGGVCGIIRTTLAALVLSRTARPAALVVAALFAIDGGTARAQVTLNVVNNFAAASGGTYFGGNIENQDVSLYFSGIGASDVTYNGGTAVTAGNQIQLSTVVGGTFSLSGSVNAARVYAILGSSAPSTIPLPSGPSPVAVTYPYAFIELTTTSGGQADQSFLNQVSFPTSLSNGIQTNSWSPTATAQSVATAFNAAFPLAPYAPSAGVAPGSGLPYDPYFALTVNRSAGAVQTPISSHRVVGASNVNLPSASPPPMFGTGYTNVPGFNNYLGWLQSNQPAEGWKFGYNSPGSPNSTYVGFLKVAGTADNYGIQLGNFTYGGTFTSGGNITGGTSVNGTVTYASNNSTQNLYEGAIYTGNWTDMTIFGATDPTGTAVTQAGDLGSLTVASVLYTVSASIGPGIMGSDAYFTSGNNTDFFFKTGLTATNAVSNFFANSQFGGSPQTGFYDQHWGTMLQAGGVSGGTYAGYFTPYDDHFDGLNVLMASDSGTLTWQIGAVPEPSAIALFTVAGVALGGLAWRRCRRRAHLR